MSNALPNIEMCPWCGYVMNEASHIDGGDGPAVRPEEGDVSICLNCALLLRFDERLGLRQPTAEEWEEIKADTTYPTIKLTQLAILARGRLPRLSREQL